MALEGRNAFPPNSVVETLFGIHDLRVPSIVPTDIRQGIESSSLVPTSTRHALDPVIRGSPPVNAAPKKPKIKLKSVRSRSYPYRNNAIWQDELPNQIPRIPKKQPHITVPSHIIPPRSKPKCRWEGRPTVRNKPLPEIGAANNSKKSAFQPNKFTKPIENSTTVSANAEPVILTETEFDGNDDTMRGSPTNTITAVDANHPQNLSQPETEFNRQTNDHQCTACQILLRKSCEIISAKDKEIVAMEKELQRTSAYNMELKSLVLEQCEDLRKTLSNSQHWKSNRDNAPPAAESNVLSISKLSDMGFRVDPDPDEVTSTPTSDFRLKRNMDWLKEQQEFLPRSDHEKLLKSPEKSTNTEIEVIPELVTLHKRKQSERLDSKLSRAEVTEFDKMGAEDLRPGSRSTLRVDATLRSRSVPSPVFRFQFGNQNPKELDPEGAEKEIKYLRISLAARQSFLKELRHRVHKAHAIFTRHQLRTTSKGTSTERLHELLDSHNTFVKWLYNFISKGVHDIQLFDELNIFVNEQRELKYYFETTHNHNGNIFKGIFVPIPFNEQLISEVTQKNRTASPKPTQSIGCQCQSATSAEPDTRSKSKELNSRVINKTIQTQTSAMSSHAPEAREMSIQTSRLFTTEQQNQTSRPSLFQDQQNQTSRTMLFQDHQNQTSRTSFFQDQQNQTSPTSLFQDQQNQTSRTSLFQDQQNQTSRTSLFQDIPKVPSKLSKARSIFQLSHSNADPIALAQNVQNDNSTSEFKSFTRVSSATPVVVNNHVHCDELSICDDTSEKSLKVQLKKIFSSSDLMNEILEKSNNNFESFVSSRKSASFKDDESRAGDFNEAPRSSLLTNAKVIYSSSSPKYPPLSATSFTKPVAASKADHQDLPNPIVNRPSPIDNEPVKARASVTEENIRKKIESITDMIRQFRSESFKSAGVEVNWTNDQEMASQKKQSNSENKPASEQELDKLMEDKKKDSVGDTNSTLPESSDREFYSFTGLCTPSCTNTVVPNTAYKRSSQSVSSETGEFEGVPSARISTAGTKNVPSQQEVSSRKTQAVESKSIQTILGKSFNVLNDNNKLEAESVSPFLEDVTSSASDTFQRSKTVLPEDCESFLRDHFEQLRRELLSSEAFQTPLPSKSRFQASSKVVSSSKLASDVPPKIDTPVLNKQEDNKASVTSVESLSAHPSKEAELLCSSIVPEENQSHVAETVLETKSKETKVPTSPGKSRIPIPIPTTSPRNTPRPSPREATNKLPQFLDKKVGSNSYPCSPRRLNPPFHYTPTPPSKRAPTPTSKAKNTPALFPRSGPPANRIVPMSNFNRFGFQTNMDTQIESDNRFQDSKPQTAPNPNRNRNLQESESPSIDSPLSLLPNIPSPQDICHYTTEYGAAFNNSRSSGSRFAQLGKEESVIPDPEYVRSKTLAANFSFSSS